MFDIFSAVFIQLLQDVHRSYSMCFKASKIVLIFCMHSKGAIGFPNKFFGLSVFSIGCKFY